MPKKTSQKRPTPPPASAHRDKPTTQTAPRISAAMRRDTFVREYLIDFNGTRAAIAAGYSSKGADVRAAQLLGDARVQEAIRAAQDKRLSKLDITADRVLGELARIGFSDLRKAVTWGPSGVHLNPSVDLDDDTARAVQEVSEHETMTEHGGSVSRKIKLYDKTKALELLGKHLGLWKERVEHTGADGQPLALSLDVKLLAREVGELVDPDKDGGGGEPFE